MNDDEMVGVNLTVLFGIAFGIILAFSSHTSLVILVPMGYLEEL